MPIKSLLLSGFTLPELLTVVAIIAISSAIAYPYLSQQLKQQESSAIKTHLTSFLKQGRQHAVIYQQAIILCVADENSQCVNQKGNYLLSFIDKNNNKSYDKGVDSLLENTNISPKYGYLTVNLSLRKNFIQLSPNFGQAAGSMGHIKYCPNDHNPQFMFKVTLNKVGIVRVRTNQEEPTGC